MLVLEEVRLLCWYRYEGNGCILADEMGLGKTLSTITLIYTMLKQSVTGTPAMSKGVIVTPSSLVSNWKREFKKWLGDERCKPLAVTKADKYTEGYIQDFVNGGAEVFSVLIRKPSVFTRICLVVISSLIRVQSRMRCIASFQTN